MNKALAIIRILIYSAINLTFVILYRPLSIIAEILKFTDRSAKAAITVTMIDVNMKERQQFNNNQNTDLYGLN